MSNWSHRELCPDGACIGVIGDDGRCRVCGAQGTGAPAPGGPDAADDRDDAAEADADAAEADADTAAPAAAVPAPAPGDAPAWDDRTLCPDGACTGLVGSDGRCSVCGRAAAEISASTT